MLEILSLDPAQGEQAAEPGKTEEVEVVARN